MSYPIKFRKLVLEYHEKGHTLRETSETFNVSVYAISDWKRLLKEKRSLEPRELNRTFKKIDPEKLREYVKKKPDAYQSEMAAFFGCSAPAVCKALSRLNITLKKRRSAIRNRTKKR